MKLYHAISSINSAMPLENCSKILLISLYLNCFRFELNDKIFISFYLLCACFLCVLDHGVNEGEPVDEQYRDQVNEHQFHDPEPEGQHLDQHSPEGFEDGKFNPAL